MEQIRLYQSCCLLGNPDTEISYVYYVWISDEQPSPCNCWLPLQR